MNDAVLIVDDEANVRFLLTKILEQQGYRCQQAGDVATAKKKLLKSSFQLLLTDMNMPGESGADLARYVKAHYPQTAVVMVTVSDDLELAKEILEIGVYGYIVKPFTPNLVLIAVQNALRRHHLEQQEIDNIRHLEEKLAQRTKKLADQLHLHQNLIDAIPLPIFYKNLAGKYLGCNRAFAQIVNFPQTWLIGKGVEEVHPPALTANLLTKDQELFRTGKVQVYEQGFTNQDGTPTAGLVHKAPLYDADGEITGLIGVRLDITELKQTEHALRTSQEKLLSIMDNLQIGVLMVGPQLEILETNRLMGHWFPQMQQTHGKKCFELFCDQQHAPCEVCPARHVFQGEKPTEVIITRQSAQGERIFRIIASPMRHAGGEIYAVLELLEDVTETLAAERELRQAQKLEAVGQLAAGIAHEINTPIQYIGDNINFLRDVFEDLFKIIHKYQQLLPYCRESPEGKQSVSEFEAALTGADLPYLTEEIPKTIKQSLEGVSRVAKIVQAMREFSHPGTTEKSLVDINQALESTLVISRNEWKYVSDIATDLAHDLPPLLCLPGEINQVFLNIIVNAAHAIGAHFDTGTNGKGLITVSTRTKDDLMEIRIGDNGGGIPEEVRHRIFDPFFTTKHVGKGTGQGLPIARSVVVDKHQGSISFDTTLGIGTTFIIRLPLSTDDYVRNPREH